MRAPDCEKIATRKGKWSPGEDEKLVAYIKRYGIWNWNEIPKAAGLLRSGKSCRLRWINYLRPNIKHGNFTKEEEETILNLHQMMGNRWSAIAARLPGRTDNEIKNYWHAHLKKLIKDNKCEAEAEHIFFPTTPTHESITASTELPYSTAEFIKRDNLVSPAVEKQ